jgi:hypothetical protein
MGRTEERRESAGIGSTQLANSSCGPFRLSPSPHCSLYAASLWVPRSLIHPQRRVLSYPVVSRGVEGCGAPTEGRAGAAARPV